MLKAIQTENVLQHVSAVKATTVYQNNHHSTTLLSRTASMQHDEPNHENSGPALQERTQNSLLCGLRE